MKLFKRFRKPQQPRAPKNHTRGAVLAAGVTIPAVVAALAVINPGVKVSEVDLNDGAVWITNTAELKLGRFNTQVSELNGAVFSSQAQFDVVQDKQDVLLVQPSRLARVDPADMALASDISIPANAKVSMANSVVAIVSEEGGLFTQQVDQLTAISEDTEPDIDLGPQGVATVAKDGTVFALAPQTATVHRIPPQGEAAPDTVRLNQTDAFDTPQLAAVGQDPVVLNGTTLVTPKTTVDLSQYGQEPVLQRSSGGRSSVLVATSSQLLDVNIATGKVTSLSQGMSGSPAAPVWVQDCAYGAWHTPTNNYVQSCSGPTEPLSLEHVGQSSELIFRVNRDQVVLNDALLGRVWLKDSVPQSELPNWSEMVAPTAPDKAEKNPDDSQSQATDLAQCQDTDAAPVAVNDNYGVRAGRTTIIPVLSNDAVGQCGIIAISEITKLAPDFGHSEIIQGGRALQVKISDTASGTASLTYTITDGRGNNPPSSATLVLKVHGESQNGDPQQSQTLKGEVEAGASLSISTLAAFWDPDGDQLVLQSAAVRAGPGSVQSRQDGTVTFTADPSQLGTSTITLTVSDGRGGATTGTLEMITRASGALVPIIDPIHEVGFVIQPIEVDVLHSVKSRSAQIPRLAAVEPVAGTVISTDLAAGTFTFTAPSTGSYYVRFTVVSGPHSVTGIARIDVRDFTEQDQAPIAVADLALLPAGGEVTVAPLVNDFDPRGGVLVLTGVSTKPDSNLMVGVIENRFVKISSRIALTEPEEITYLVDNGVGAAQGTILVQPVPPNAQQTAPVVAPIKVSVRTTGVVTIPALDYVTDADGDTVKLVQDLPQALGAGEGLLFVSGDNLRYQAPAQPRTTKTLFNVIDTAGNIATGELTVVVHASDAQAKAPPTPKDLTARAYSGKSIIIQIPLTGIDRDGDGVSLLGLGDQVPNLGRISGMGADWLEYTADPNQRGTDVFTYAVEDWTGQRAVGTIRVGIVADPAVPLPIVASDDQVTVRPGTTVEVRVLRNDVDPSGLELSLEPLGTVPGVNAHIQGRRIVVEVPQNATGVIAIPYAVRNALGNRGEAVLRVTIEQDAEIANPIARDIIVAPLEVLDKDSAQVDVLEVAENPSGALSDLSVSIPASHADVAQVSGGSVTITLSQTSQTIPYRLTNTSVADGSVYSYAFITVPAKGDFPPVLRPKAPELRVASGAELTIPVAAHVQVGTGKQAYIRDSNTVRSNQSDGSNLLVSSDQLRFVSKPGYAGNASITFEVWDYAVPTPGERSTVLTLPITVFAEDKLPPTFHSANIMVPQGSEPITVDLGQLTSFPDGTVDTQVTYRSTSVSMPGVRVDISGTTLSISADDTVSRGTQGQVLLAIGYGISGEISAPLNFTVVASNLPKPAVNNHEVIADAGVPTTVDVLAGANDPYGKGLKILGVTVLTPDTGATARISGNQVTITPGTDFAGTIEVSAIVTDALNDPNRTVESKITVQVRKAPEPPRAPTITDTSSRTVKLAWDSPQANGTPVIDYLVTRHPSGTTTVCPTTTCAITGLTNGTEYTFSVAARNAVGLSQNSTVSQPVTPDSLPSAPAVPTVVEADREITVAWTAPENEGSAISSYTVEISPAVDGRSRYEAVGTTLTIKGLTNGTGYTARVRANNAAKRVADDGWSSTSLVAVPAGVPGAPDVRAVSDGDARLKISWQGPESSNGSPLTGYTVTLTADGQEPVTRDLEATAREWTFTKAKNGVTYKVEVRARNKVGTSAPSAPVKVATYKSPDAPTAGSAINVPGRGYAQGSAVKLNWQAPADAGGVGVTIKGYEIDLPGSGSTTVPGTTLSFQIEGLTPGQTTSNFRVRAINSLNEPSSWAEISGVPTVTKPQAPSLSGTGGWETFSFHVVAGHDGGAPAQLEYRINLTGAWKSVPSTGTVTEEYTSFQGDSVTAKVNITVRATNAQGEVSATGETTVNRIQPPQPPEQISAHQVEDEWKVNVLWTAAKPRGTAVTGYQYCLGNCQGQGQWQTVPGTETALILDSGLSGKSSVKIQVRATSSRGPSPAAQTTLNLTPPKEPEPTEPPDPEPEPTGPADPDPEQGEN